MFRRVAPHDIALFPRDAQNLRTCAVDVDHRLRSQISDSRLEADPAIGRDHKKSVKTGTAANVTAEGDAHAAHFGANPLRIARRPLLPFELLRSALQRFLDEC